MRVAHVGIRNFRCLEKFDLRLDEITVLVGANGTGKSSVLHALSWFFTGGPLDLDDVTGRQEGLVTSVSVTFRDFNDADREALGTYVVGDEATFERSWSSGADGKLTGHSLAFRAFEEVRAQARAQGKIDAYRALCQSRSPRLGLTRKFVGVAPKPPKREAGGASEAIEEIRHGGRGRLDPPEQALQALGIRRGERGERVERRKERLGLGLVEVHQEHRNDLVGVQALPKMPVDELQLVPDAARNATTSEAQHREVAIGRREPGPHAADGRNAGAPGPLPSAAALAHPTNKALDDGGICRSPRRSEDDRREKQKGGRHHPATAENLDVLFHWDFLSFSVVDDALGGYFATGITNAVSAQLCRFAPSPPWSAPADAASCAVAWTV